MAFEKIENDIWKPENKGDEIVGTLISKESDVGANNSMLYTLEVDEKPIAFWGCTVLDPKMLTIKEGELIKVVYLGKGESKGGKNPPKLFDVYVDKDVPSAQPTPTENKSAEVISPDQF